MPRTVFVTGAGGYVGRRLLARLPTDGVCRAVGLARVSRPDNGAGVELVRGDLLEPGGYRGALAGCEAVVHLAAVTGKARPAEYERVNVEGTRRLIEACVSTGVGRFLFVSTIAVTFRDRPHYHYAASKERAERVVAGSGLRHAILRPTIVAGPGAPVVEGLARLAGMPIMPVFGDGRAAVQPIHVEDLVEGILAILRSDRFTGEVIELGGPEVLSIEALMVRIAEARSGSARRALHLPLRPIRALLGLVEPLLLPVLPLTAGQLATFANDGIAGKPAPAGGPTAKIDLSATLDSRPPEALDDHVGER